MEVKLKGIEPIARGRDRLVFAHPSDPGLLVKVMRPKVREERRTPQGLLQRLRRERVLGSFIREMREQLILAGHGEDYQGFLQRIAGFCDSDLGVGMLVEAVRTPEGRLAPSLRVIVSEGGFDEAARRDLDAFCARILASRIVVGALFAKNLLYGADGDGRRRFVLVDGYGEASGFGLRGTIAALNRRAKVRLIRKLDTAIERIATKSADKAARRAPSEGE